jgi:hypothetical protein
VSSTFVRVRHHVPGPACLIKYLGMNVPAGASLQTSGYPFRCVLSHQHTQFNSQRDSIVTAMADAMSETTADAPSKYTIRHVGSSALTHRNRMRKP